MALQINFKLNISSKILTSCFEKFWFYLGLICVGGTQTSNLLTEWFATLSLSGSFYKAGALFVKAQYPRFKVYSRLAVGGCIAKRLY